MRERRWSLPVPQNASGFVVVAFIFCLFVACGEAPQQATVATSPVADASVAAIDATASPDSAAAAAVDSVQSAPTPTSNPLILAVSPEQGPAVGLTEVEINGIGFTNANAVLFGESPGIEMVVIDDFTIRVQSPPRPAGFVDITVRLVDEDNKVNELVLPLAFRYVADVQLHSVAPAKGDVLGGDLVTVTGAGFSQATSFVFGDRLAIDPLIIDEFTAAMHTPPGQAGAADVRVSNVDGSAVLKKGWWYDDLLQIDYAAPGTAPLGGGNVVRIYGRGLHAAGASIALLVPSSGATQQPKKALIGASDPHGLWIEITTPDLQDPGAYDVSYSRGTNNVIATKLIYYVSPSSATTKGTNEVLAVTPNSGAINKQHIVAIHLSGPITRQQGAAVEVRMSAKKLKLVTHDVGVGGPQQNSATIVVEAGPETWTSLPVTVNIRVDVGYEDVKKASAFTWTVAQALIETVTPAEVDTAGGTPFTVHWDPAGSQNIYAVGVRVGALFASQVKNKGKSKFAPKTVTAMAPKGSAGPADVQLVMNDGTIITKSGALNFVGATPTIAALQPARGSVAGGSWVDLTGSGLQHLERVYMDAKIVTDLSVVHSGLARFRTPRGKPGPVTVTARWKNGSETVLDNAYVYFDPMAGNYGTWGPAIDRDVNVTVLQANQGGGRVADALVVVERGDKVWTGKTNDAGQVTISEPGLVGPVTVSASKVGYSAASVVKVNVENVTVRLRKASAPPPSQGSGQPDPPPQEDPFPDGIIFGQVVNAAKYAKLPMGDCAIQPAVGGNCKPCKSKADCFGGQTCELLRDPLQGFDLGASQAGLPTPKETTETQYAGTQRYCVSMCLTDANCPYGFECRAISLATNTPELRCTPRIGTPQTRCETSSPSMFGGNPNPGAGSVANADGAFSIASRLGDLAVFCRSGYVEKGSGTFVPLVMGLARNLHMLPGGTIQGVKVPLTTPLTRTVRIRLDRIPMGPDVKDAERYMYSALNLEPEGYIRMGFIETSRRTDVLELLRQPSTFADALKGISYDLYGGLASPGGGAPRTVSAREDMKPQDADHLGTWMGTVNSPSKSTAWATPMTAMAYDGYTTVAVGSGGWIGVWGSGQFTQQSTPTKRDLYAVWMDPAGTGDGWAGGDHGTLLRRNNITGWQAFGSPVSAPTPGSPDDAHRIRAIHGRAGDDVWLLTGSNVLYHWDGKGWMGPILSPVGPPVNKPNTWAPWKDSPRLRSLFCAPNGDLLVVGDSGFIFRGTPKGTQVQWSMLQSLTQHSLHAVWGLSDTDFWVAGEAGTLARYANGQFNSVPTGTLMPLYGLQGDAKGVHAVGGLGTWLTVDLQGKLTNHTIADMSVDLKAVAQTGGGLVSGGLPTLVMGPYLELPYITEPSIYGVVGKWLRWKAAPGVTPTLHLVRITTYDYKTLWELYVKGDVNQVKLPDFQALGAFDPLVGGKMRVRLWRIYAPGLNIDHYNHKQLNVWKWISYAYNYVITNQATDLSGAQLPPSQVPAGAGPEFSPFDP